MTFVQFASALRSKACRCSNAYPKEKTGCIFKNFLRILVLLVLITFQHRVHKVRLLEATQNKNALRESARVVSDLFQVATWKQSFNFESCGGTMPTIVG